jgi:hypothetical protein
MGPEGPWTIGLSAGESHELGPPEPGLLFRIKFDLGGQDLTPGTKGHGAVRARGIPSKAGDVIQDLVEDVLAGVNGFAIEAELDIHREHITSRCRRGTVPDLEISISGPRKGYRKKFRKERGPKAPESLDNLGDGIKVRVKFSSPFTGVSKWKAFEPKGLAIPEFLAGSI